MTSSPFAAVHNGGSHSAHLSRASSDAQLASMQDAPDFTALFRFLASPARCMHLSRLSPPPRAHTPHPLGLPCCPRAWLPTDAGWECRAQLGLIAAVYLIKT